MGKIRYEDGSNFVRHVGLAHKLLLAADKAGFTATDINELAQNKRLLQQFLAVKREDAEIRTIQRIIDCDNPPLTFRKERNYPKGDLSVIRHDKLGIVPWKSLKLRVLSPRGLSTDDRTLDEEHLVPRYLVGRRVANANVREYLIQYPHLIPDGLYSSSPAICWGTVYESKKYEGLSAPGLYSQGMPYNIAVRPGMLYDFQAVIIDE